MNSIRNWLAAVASSTLIVLGLPASLDAQAPTQLSQFVLGDPMSPQASALTSVGSQVFFSTTPAPGTALGGLWRSDGSPAGTVRFRSNVFVELNGFSAPGMGEVDLSPVVINGVVYFIGYNGTLEGPRGLWRSDLTAGGTFEIARFTSGGGMNAWPNRLVVVGSSLYFSVENTVWRSQGTTLTTEIMRDFGTFGARPQALSALGNTLLFSTNPMTTGPDAGIWRCDGTPASTQLIKPLAYIDFPGFLEPGEHADSRRPVESGGLLYFSGFEGSGTGGNGLWRSDGTLSGTFEIRRFEISPGITLQPRDLVDRAGIVHFFVGSQFWRSGPTENTSQMIFDFATMGGTLMARPSSLIGVGDAFMFAVSEPTQPLVRGLWRSDGSTLGTERFNSRVTIDMSSGPPGPTPPADKRPIVVGRVAFFAGSNPNQAIPGENGALYRSGLSSDTTYVIAEFLDPLNNYFISPTQFRYAGQNMFVLAQGNVFVLRPRVCESDFNGDGDINADDLGDFINTYFSPCP
ncbi:MAG: hypothetical protein AB7K52_11745 [Phycisphaerales bacterium]